MLQYFTTLWTSKDFKQELLNNFCKDSLKGIQESKNRIYTDV